jgi:hypothetical protein
MRGAGQVHGVAEAGTLPDKERRITWIVVEDPSLPERVMLRFGNLLHYQPPFETKGMPLPTLFSLLTLL